MDRKVRAFLAIVEEGTLTAAANRIGLAQPSLTKFLQRLETEMGARLFERKIRGMELTSFGKAFLVHARRIEAEYKFATEEIAAMQYGGLPVLRIGAGALFHMLHVPYALTQLVREFPGTRIDVVANVNKTTVPMLQRGELDVVCGEIEPSAVSYGIESEVLLTADLGVIMRANHPQAETPMMFEALSAYPFIVFQHDEPAQAELSRLLGARRLNYRIAVSTSSFATGLRLVRATDYLMIAPMQLKSVIAETGLIVRAPEEPIRSFRSGIMMRTSSRAIPIVTRLTELLKQSIAAVAV
ncbi:MAG: LysR family transcriptional regulator [Proteobacteria bacterium]|nr:LysR family transcriptional regulator [Pseudomonadota bacterium]